MKEETSKPNKQILKIVLSFTGLIFIIAVSVFLTRYLTLKEIGLVSKNFLFVEEEPVRIENFENRWDFFIDDEKAEYIVSLCEGFEVDVDLAMSILLKENPTVKEVVVGEANSNGTVDVGMWQLNDRSLYTKDGFVDSYWEETLGEFDPMKWRHNTYIAIRYIDTLQGIMGKRNLVNIVAAYNCGPGRVLNGEIPSTTFNDYIPSVMNNYRVLTKG